jgi:hypothetical protein
VTDTPITCPGCNHQIGRKTLHFILEDLTVICPRCFRGRGRAKYACRTAHAKFYPNCLVAWHDMYDHQVLTAERDAANGYAAQQLNAGKAREIKDPTTQ